MHSLLCSPVFLRVVFFRKMALRRCSAWRILIWSQQPQGTSLQFTLHFLCRNFYISSPDHSSYYISGGCHRLELFLSHACVRASPCVRACAFLSPPPLPYSRVYLMRPHPSLMKSIICKSDLIASCHCHKVFLF